MNYELRPLTLAEILDAAFRLVQTEWQTLIGLSLIMQIPVFFIAIAVPQLFDPFAQPLETGEEISEQLAFALVAGLAGIVFFYAILYPFVAAAVTASVGNFYLGRRFDLREAAHAGARSFLRLIAAYFVWGIAYLFAAVAVFGAAALLFGIGGALFGDAIESMGGAGIALAVVLGIAIGGAAFFWIQSVRRRASSIASIRARSTSLTEVEKVSTAISSSTSRAPSLAMAARMRRWISSCVKLRGSIPLLLRNSSISTSTSGFSRPSREPSS